MTDDQSQFLEKNPMWEFFSILAGGIQAAPRENADELEDRDQSEPLISEDCANGEHPSCDDDECECRCHEPDEEE